jgi:hypothetical protein
MGDFMKIASAIAMAALIATAASAQPFADTAPPVGKAFEYQVSNTGGTGAVTYKIKNPPAGSYMASFAAVFVAQGTKTKPNEFTCWLQADGLVFAESTNADISKNWFIGVSAEAPITITKDTTLEAVCTNNVSEPWSYVRAPLKVTFVRLDSTATGKITIED